MQQTARARFLERLTAELDAAVASYRAAERRLHADRDDHRYVRPLRYGGQIRRAQVVAWVASNAMDAAAWRLCRAEAFLRGELERFHDGERRRTAARDGRRAA